MTTFKYMGCVTDPSWIEAVIDHYGNTNEKDTDLINRMVYMNDERKIREPIVQYQSTRYYES